MIGSVQERYVKCVENAWKMPAMCESPARNPYQPYQAAIIRTNLVLEIARIPAHLLEAV
jgi:hypothetical protein